MAREEGSDVPDDDESVVPITAPGHVPRDLTIDPTTDDDRPLDPQRRSDSSHRSGRRTRSSRNRRNTEEPERPPRHPDRVVIDEPFGTSAADADRSGQEGHVVGHDRLADVVATFGSTLESIRASQGHAPRHNLPTGSSTNQKRIAQVVQATPIEATEVVDLIRTRRATVTLLDLDADTPAVGRGDVVFPGRLLMPGRTRRRVDLRIYPTASGNLTVLELLPRRSWMPQTRRYLRAGVPAITALSDAIEAAASGSDHT